MGEGIHGRRVTVGMRRVLGAGSVLVTALVTSGCSYLGTATAFDPKELDQCTGWLAIREVPEIRQKEATDCGVAALAMILGYWSLPCSEQKAASDCPVIPGQGTQACDLREAARKSGLEAYLIHGEIEDLRIELAENHPLVVGLIKAHVGGALTHYEVVVGLHSEKRIVLTLDPSHGWRQNTIEGFLNEWEPTGRLTLVVFRKSSPGDSPGGGEGLPHVPGKKRVSQGSGGLPAGTDSLSPEPPHRIPELLERRTR
jgi:hypothetical protein